MTGQLISRSPRWRCNPLFVRATVAVALFTDIFLYSLVVPVLPFLIHNRFSIPEQDVQPYVSQLIAANAGATVLFSIPAGWVCDKVSSRKLPLLVGSALLGMGTALFAFGQQFRILLLARGLQGVAAAVIWTVGLAMIKDSVGPKRMGQAFGSILSFTTAGEVVAPVLGGMLYDKAGIRAVFGTAAGLYVVDLIMRLLFVETRKAKTSAEGSAEDSNDMTPEARLEPEPREDDLLLPSGDDCDAHKIKGKFGPLLRTFPVLYCFREPRLLAAMTICVIEGSITGIFEATFPTEAASLFSFSSFQVGLVYTTLIVPYMCLIPFAGMAVDKYGTKLVATYGHAFLVPCLALLGLPSQQLITGNGNVVLFCVIMALNGAGRAIVSPPSVAEASIVTSRFEAANPGFFGENGPYAQIFGFRSVFVFSGLTIGPLLGGALRESFGYGTMGLVFSALSGLTAVFSYFFIGEWDQASNGRARHTHVIDSRKHSPRMARPRLEGFTSTV